MGKIYNYEQVKAFTLIGLDNFLHSANKDNIKLEDFFKLFIEPLEEIYKKKDVIECANKLKNV